MGVDGVVVGTRPFHDWGVSTMAWGCLSGASLCCSRQTTTRFATTTTIYPSFFIFQEGVERVWSMGAMGGGAAVATGLDTGKWRVWLW